MKTFKAFLILTFLSCSFFAQAFNYACIGKDDTVSPNPKTYTDSAGVTHDTQPWIDWKNAHSNHSISKDWGCCDKLVREGDTCKDKSIVDESLQTCSNHGSCPSGLGCYKLRADEDLFNEDNSEGSSDSPQLLAFEKQQETELGEDEDLKENGEACYRNLECSSYSCEKFKCVDRFICREGDLDEIAPGNIKCDDSLVKDPATGKCISAGINFYSGLIGEVAVQQLSGQQCQFQVVPANPALTFKNLQHSVNLSVVSLRSMEWLFSTASGANHVECQFVKQLSRDKVQEFVNERREILYHFNKDMIFIEDNFAIINGAKKDDMSNVTTLCTDAAGNYEMTTKHDVALRKASGKDFLCYLKRRNLLFKEYEKAMFSWAGKVQAFVKNYSDTIFSWSAEAKEWNVLGIGKNHDDRDRGDWASCRKRIKKRWGQRFKASGRKTVNTDIIERTGKIAEFFSYIDADAKSKFTGGKYWLLDPLMPGGYNQSVDFQNYGEGRFSMWSSDKDRYLGDNDKGYKQIYEGFTKRLPEFYKGLRKEIAADKFIYEPEIPSSYDLRGCIDKIDDPKCSRLKDWLTMIQDMAFVQMLTYSHHTKNRYKYFYLSPGTLRRKLFNQFDVSLINLSKYYAALSGDNGLRDKQDSCLAKAIDQFNGEDFKGEGVGVTEGSTNYYQATDGTYLQNNQGPTKYNKPNIKNNMGIPARFSLSTYNFSLKDSGGLKDSSRQNSGASSGSLSSEANAALAARVKLMEDANAKAALKGVNVAAKDAALRQSLANGGLVSSLGSAGANALGQRGSSFGSMGGGHSSSSSDKNEENTKDGSNQYGNQFGANGFGIPSGSGKSGFQGVVGGAGSGAGSSSSSNSSSSKDDPTGLSDEEKDVMSANYERNKKDYKTSEDDSLFQVLSKTYVRNLDKVLTRKKKLDDEADSRELPKP